MSVTSITSGNESAQLSKTSSTYSLLSEHNTSLARPIAFNPNTPIPEYNSDTWLPGGTFFTTSGTIPDSKKSKLD